MLSLNTVLTNAAAAGLLKNEDVRIRWIDIVGKNPDLRPTAIEVGLIAEVKKAQVVKPLQLFEDKNKIQHSLGCFLIYMLSEAAKPTVSYKKRWAMIDRVIKHTDIDVSIDITPTMYELYRASSGIEYIVELFAQIKPAYEADYHSCDCRKPVEAPRPTCPKCGSAVKSNGAKRWKCKMHGHSFAK